MATTDESRRAQRVLRQHVQTDRLMGVDAVPLGEARSLPVADSPRDTPAAAAAPPANANAAAPGPTRSAKELSPAMKLKVLGELEANEVRGCTACVLSESRTQTVFGEGDPNADLMFVGEGPGQTEDELGRPFVGRSGDLLTKMILAMGLSREQIYIANMVKCRPPSNRTPLAPEIQACSDFLRRQIQIIRPKVIVTLGGPAAKYLLNTTQGVTLIRGQWHQYDGLLPEGPAIPVMPTFHPAYLLRAYTQENRAKVWSDLQQVMDRLGLKPPTP